MKLPLQRRLVAVPGSDPPGLWAPGTDLSPEQVEVLGGRARVGHAKVDVVTVRRVLTAVRLLQEALQPVGGVLGPRPVVAMGQEHDQAALEPPLGCRVGRKRPGGTREDRGEQGRGVTEEENEKNL